MIGLTNTKTKKQNMSHPELLYLLALQKVVGLGDKSIKKMVHLLGSPKAVFESPIKQLAQIPGINKKILANINQHEHLTLAQKEIELIAKHDIKTTSWLDDTYPEKLKLIPDHPCLLHYKGSIEPLPTRIISVVGTRKITAYGKGFLTHFFKEIAAFNPIIVSGLAYGVDGFAHQLALDNNLTTYGVLAHGLYRIYPPAHASMAKNMVNQGGCVITECHFHAKPDRENFPKRNRIIAGLSNVTLVIESDVKGGSMITARLANDYNRDVMAVPGNITNKQSSGCNFLIKNNEAHMLTEPDDLIKLMNWETNSSSPKQTQLLLDLTKQEQQIVDLFINGSTITIDQIASHLNWSSSQVSMQLLGLEMKGIIASLPGARYKQT